MCALQACKVLVGFEIERNRFQWFTSTLKKPLWLMNVFLRTNGEVRWNPCYMRHFKTTRCVEHFLVAQDSSLTRWPVASGFSLGFSETVRVLTSQSLGTTGRDSRGDPSHQACMSSSRWWRPLGAITAYSAAGSFCFLPNKAAARDSFVSRNRPRMQRRLSLMTGVNTLKSQRLSVFTI